MRKFITPTVNLNGSDAQELINYRMTVYNKIDEAIAAIYAALPHGRDYQHLIKAEDWSLHRTTVQDAREAFLERVRALQAIRDDFVNDAVAIQRQREPRLKVVKE